MENSAFYLSKRLITVLLCLFLFYSCSKENLEQEIKLEEVNLEIKDPDVVDGQYVVILSKKPEKKDQKAAAALEALSKEIGAMPNAKLKGMFRQTLTGFAAKLTQAQVQKLQKDPRVFSIHPDKFIELEASPTINNTVAVQEYSVWGLDRIDQRENLLDRVYAYTATGNGVNAYIMDSGIRFTHEDFAGRASLGIDLVREYPDPEFDLDDPEVEDGSDCNGHGSHVAGTVGGENFGVAKDVNLISVRVFSCRGRTTWSRIILAVDWITENAVHPAVVNMSLGDLGSYEPMETAVQNSIATGIHYVVAAGNSQIDACDFTPARVPEVVTVGASDIYNKRAVFSNYGNCLDLYAPGVAITSAGIADDISTRIISGTSMAAPHVAGLVALYLEKNPEATPLQVQAAIIENSTPDYITEVPYGPTNLAHSLWEAVDFTPPPAPEISLKAFLSKVRGEHAINLQWNTPEESSHHIFRDGVIIARKDNAEKSYTEYTSVKHATFIYKVCGIIYDNCSQEIKVVIGNGGTTTEPTNSPPSAGFTYSAELLTVQFTDTSSDPDGSIVAWAWNFGDGSSSTDQNPSYSYSAAGAYTVTVTVTDDAGATANNSKNISVNTEEPLPGGIVLSANGFKTQGKWSTDLYWTPAGTSANVDIYRNGSFLRSAENLGSYKDNTNFKGGGTLTYKVCEAGTANCSNEVLVQF